MTINSPYQPTSLARLARTVAKSMKSLTDVSRTFVVPAIPKLPQPSTYLPSAKLIQQAQKQRATQLNAVQTLLRSPLHIVSPRTTGKTSLLHYCEIFEKHTAAVEATRLFFEREQLFPRSFKLQSLNFVPAQAAAEAAAAVQELKNLRNLTIHSIDGLIEGLGAADFSGLDCVNFGLTDSQPLDLSDEVDWIIKLLEQLKNTVNETWEEIVRCRRALKDKSTLIDCSCTALSRFARRTRAMLLTYQIKHPHLPNGRLLSVFNHLRGYLMQLHSLVTPTQSRCYFPSPIFSQNVAVSGLII